VKFVTVIVMLFTVTAFAQTPADAPVSDIPGVSVKITTGTPAPFTGRLLSDTENIRRGDVSASKDAELRSLTAPENITVTKGQLTAVIVGPIVLTAIVTALIVGFAKK
jgi:hypothetical protein